MPVRAENADAQAEKRGGFLAQNEKPQKTGRAKKNTPPGKNSKPMLRDIGEQAGNDEQAHDERRQKANADQLKIRCAEGRKILV